MSEVAAKKRIPMSATKSLPPSSIWGAEHRPYAGFDGFKGVESGKTEWSSAFIAGGTNRSQPKETRDNDEGMIDETITLDAN